MDRELLFSLTAKDFEIETFQAGGKGGQHQNKTNSGVRIRHPASGAVAECRDERSQLQNRKRAFEKLVKTPQFQAWHKKAIAKALLSKEEQRKIESWLEEQLDKKNLRIEYLEAGK